VNKSGTPFYRANMRENRVRLSDTELAQVKSTRQIVYGDSSVPMGVVIKQACEEMVVESNDNDESEVGVKL
jgi:DNA-binding beta-propeller fold protein YncE